MTTTATTVTTNTKHGNLHAAKKAKNDEFYTRWVDIEKEVMSYVSHNPDAFRGKTILLPCDDPKWSNFTKFFALRFDTLGLKKLISTSYTKDGTPGKVFILERDITGDGRTNLDDIEEKYLEGDGDFRSDEVRTLRDEADIIVTNPPFSLFREFLSWIMEADKQFLMLGNPNAITYKEIFPLLKDNKLWWGVKSSGGVNMFFDVPEWYAENLVATKPEGSFWKRVDGKVLAGIKTVWFTNIDHGRRHEPLDLMTMAENLRYNPALRGKTAYDRYDNYDAIEIPKVVAIPSDYDGVMGVPITFLDKYCPEQFEIVGATESEGKGFSRGLWISESGVAQALIDGNRIYKRIFIKHRR